jgi:hypothetical protein
VAKGNPEQLVCQEAYDWFIDTFESDAEAKSEYIVEVLTLSHYPSIFKKKNLFGR